MSKIGVYVEILFDTFVTIFYHFDLWCQKCSCILDAILPFTVMECVLVKKVDTF